MQTITRVVQAAMMLGVATLGSSPSSSTAADTTAATLRVITKAKTITLPEFTLDDVTFQEAVERLAELGKKHDANRRGIDIVLSDTAYAEAAPKLTLALKNVTFATAADRLAEAAGIRVSAECFGFHFRGKTNSP